MSIVRELKGKTFGKLVVLNEVLERENGYRLWNCKCECGNEVVVKTAVLIGGYKKSCGCLSREVTTERSTKHGFAARNHKHPLYGVWNDMKRRCYSKARADYPNYGGRGIIVCDRWLEPNGKGFLNFLDDMGERPSQSHSIDRIDVNGNYEPKNCKWSTRLEQNNNTRKNRFITVRGKTQTLAQWAKELGIGHATVLMRIKNGWTEDAALFTPVQVDRNKYITFNGETLTLKDWAKKLKIPVGTIQTRLFSGFDLEDVLTPKNLVEKTLELNGETHTLNEWENIIGISANLISNRIGKGWSVERALTTKPVDLNKYHTLNGITKSHQEWAKEYGLNEATLRYRLKKGCPLEDALTKPLQVN